MDLPDTTSTACLGARRDCALFPHKHRGIIEVSGSDALTFLHNILSNDIKTLSPGEGTVACLLKPSAQLIANMNVYRFEQNFWLTFDFELKEKVLESIKKLIVSEDVTAQDRSDEFRRFTIHGPKSKELARVLIGENYPQKLLSHHRVPIQNIPTLVVNISLIGEPAFSLLLPKEKGAWLQDLILEIGKKMNLVMLSPSAFEILRIEAGTPRYGVDYDESHLPLQADFAGSVSFNKGCFPGQEILARLDSRGGISQKLCGLTLKGEVAPKKGDRVFHEDHEVGHITSSVFSPTLKRTIAMAHIKKECWAVGSSVTVETIEALLPGRVEALPFYTSLHTTL